MIKASRVARRLSAWCQAIGILLIAGSALAAAPSPAPGEALEKSFLGKLHGSGTIQDWQHGVRTVTFSGVGTPIQGGLRLTYDVVFSDGEHQHKVWTFIKTGEGHYLGHRDDVVGDAEIIQSGDDIHMSYTGHVATKDGIKDLRFDEHFTLTASGTIINRLTASYLLFNVGSGEITIRETSNRS